MVNNIDRSFTAEC